MARQATIKVVKIREWINTCCYREDIARIDRMFRHALNKIGPGVDAPLWEKEKFFNKWLEMDFSPADWQKAGIQTGTSGGWIGLGVTASDCMKYGSTKLA